MTNNPTPTDVGLWLETAATALRTIDGTWTDDADAVASAAMSIDPNPRRHVPDPERLRDLRQALHIVEGLIDDMADAEAT
jgi:hypothetical protein